MNENKGGELEKEEAECPCCMAMVDITGLRKKEGTHCHNCQRDLIWTGNELIENDE